MRVSPHPWMLSISPTDLHLVIAERRKNPSERKDFLYTMLNGKDPQTGNGLTDESVVQQV